MSIMDLNFVVLFQRAIELFAFYLILANLRGIDLKESLTRLFSTKQKVFYGNWVLMVVYPIAIALIFQLSRDYAYMIDQLLRPFVAYFLLRLIVDWQKLLVSYAFSMVTIFIVGGIAFIFSINEIPLHGMFVFLSNLAVVIFMAHQNYFENIYVRLVNRKHLLNVISVFSLILYSTLFFSVNFSIIFPIISLLLFGLITFHLRRETTNIVKRIEKTSPEDLFQILRDISFEYRESDVGSQYTIRNYKFTEIAYPLGKALDSHRRRSTFRDYECVIAKRQIKINVLL